MSDYSNYASGMNAGSSVLQGLTAELINSINKKNNDLFNGASINAFISDRETYVQGVKEKLSYYDEIIAEGEEKHSQEEISNATNRRATILENYQKSINTDTYIRADRKDVKVSSVNNALWEENSVFHHEKVVRETYDFIDTSLATDKTLREQVRYLAFDDFAQFNGFQASMEDMGVGGTALADRHNGQYVYIIPKVYDSVVEEYEKNNLEGVPIDEYVENQMEKPDDYNKSMGNGIISPMSQAFYSADNGSSAKIASIYGSLSCVFTGEYSTSNADAENVNLFDKEEKKGYESLTTQQLALKWNEDVFLEVQGLSKPKEHSAIFKCAEEMKIDLASSDKNIFAKNVAKMQTQIFKVSNGKLMLDRNGHLTGKGGNKFDIKGFASMEGKVLKAKYGITENQRDALLLTMERGQSFHLMGFEALGLNKFLEKEGQDTALVRDLRKGMSRSRQLYKASKGGLNIYHTQSALAHQKKYENMLEKAEKLNPEKADEMFKKAKAYNDKFVKQQEKIRNKAIKKAEKQTIKANSKFGQRIGKMTDNRNAFYKKLGGIGKKFTWNKTLKTGEVIQKSLNLTLNGVFSAINKVKLKIASCVGSVLLTLIKFVVLGMVAFLPAFIILSLVDSGDSVALKCKERLEKQTDKWIEELATSASKEGRGWGGFGGNWNDILYTKDYLTGEEYINKYGKSIGLEVRGGTLYTNIFGFEPLNSNNLKKITKIDGGSSLEIVPYGTSSHTNNIKEILCMTDVWFELDQDSNASLSDTKREMRRTGRINKRELKRSKAQLSGTEELDEGNYATWGRVADYADGLFDISHQESFELELVVLPVKSEGARYARCTSIIENTENQLTSGKIYVCPEADKGGCATVSDFHYFYSNGRYDNIGIYDVNGQVHFVGDLVTASGTSCCPVQYGSNVDAGATYGRAVTSGCWSKIDSGDSGWIGTADLGSLTGGTYYEWDASTNTVKKVSTEIQHDTNSHEEDDEGNRVTYGWVEKRNTKTGKLSGEWCWKRADGTKVTNHHTVYEQGKSGVYKNSYETYKWECKGGHSGHYCGGHVKLNTTGYVYSFSDKDIAIISGEEDGEVKGKVDESKVDFTTISTAQRTGGYPVSSIGWNVSNENNGRKDTVLKEITVNGRQISSLNYMNDIFDCDMRIQYGEKSSLLSENYKLFTTWTADNMELAMTKYSMDWFDTYEFDIQNSLGSYPLNDEMIEAVKNNLIGYEGFSDSQKTVIDEALRSVGNVAYDRKSHDLLYKNADKYNTKTDVAGWTLYMLKKKGASVYDRDTLKDLYEKATVSNGGYVAGDIVLCRYNNTNSVGCIQAYVYLGKCKGETILRKDGSTLMKCNEGTDIFVGIDVLSKKANCFLCNCGSGMSAKLVGDVRILR